MTALRRFRLGLFAPACSAALLGCAATTLGTNLGIDISSQSQTIRLAWDSQHAWNASLMSRGADLVAEYRVGNGTPVKEVVARGAIVAAQDIEFTLPQELKGAPVGRVCLYVQPLGVPRALLPVRRAENGRDTARFQYPEWSAQVAERGRLTGLARDLDSIASRSTGLATAITARQAALARRGWSGPQACDAPVAVSATASTPPPGVVPDEAHDRTARQVCVSRVIRARTLLGTRMGELKPEQRAALFERFSAVNLALPEAAEFLAKQGAIAGVPPEVMRQRTARAREVVDDWKRFAPTIGRDYWPAFGNFDDLPMLIDESQAASHYFNTVFFGGKFGVATPPQPDGQAMLGAIGAMLDSYSGCVDDGKRQLKTNLDAWNAMQAASPERARRLGNYLQASCRAEFDKLAAMQVEQADLKRQAADLSQGGANAAPGAGLPTRRQALNGIPCDI